MRENGNLNYKENKRLKLPPVDLKSWYIERIAHKQLVSIGKWNQWCRTEPKRMWKKSGWGVWQQMALRTKILVIGKTRDGQVPLTSCWRIRHAPVVLEQLFL